MFKRIVIALLWFAAFLCLHEIAWSVFGSPRVLGIAAGALAASFVYFDPKHVFSSPETAAVHSAAR